MIETTRLGGSLRTAAHFAAVRMANAVIRGMGLRPLLTPALSLIGACFGNEGKVLLRVDDVTLEIPLSDAYWVAAGMDGSYEAEIFRFAEALDDRPTLFIDGGANVGWWSLLAEKRWGWTSVAIEASSALVARIEKNRSSNGASFTILHNALWRSNGERLTFRTGSHAHAGGHLGSVAGFVGNWRLEVSEDVNTVTVDSIVSHSTSQKRFDRILIKLDVEGAEREAIEGAQNAVARGALLIYEDHGSDRACSVTATLFNMGLCIYGLEQRVRQMHTLDDVMRSKANRRQGYNFLAVDPRCAGAMEINQMATEP
jgi:FkbM family methyltransferase